MLSGKLERIVFLFVVVVGLVFVFLVPPFQKPDEIDHFYKSAGLLNLRNCPLKGLCVEKRFYDLPKRTQAEVQFWDYSKKFDYRLLFFEDDDKSVVSYAANFSWQTNPLVYTFSSLGVWLGSFSPNPLVALYFGRIFNFCFFLICLFLAIRIVPTDYKKIILFFTSLPMVLHQATAVSHDAIWLALVMVVFSWWLKIWEQNETKLKEYLFFVLTVLAFAFIRYGNWFMFLLAILVPYKRVNKKIYRVVLGFWFILLLVAIVGRDWFWRQIGLLGLPASGRFYGLQSDILLNHPLFFLRSVLNSFARNNWTYFKGVVGRLGWLDYNLGIGTYLIYLALFFWLVDTVAKKSNVKLTFGALVGLLTVLVMSVLSIFVGMYLYEGLPGQSVILVQGRYFLALLPFLMYFLIGVWQKLKEKKLERLILGLVLFLVLANIFGATKKRYYDYFSWVEADNFLRVKAVKHFDTPEDIRQEKLYLVDEKFTHNFGLENFDDKILGFEFVFNSGDTLVNVPYRFYIRDKNCQKDLTMGFLNQKQLEKEKGVYRYRFSSAKTFDVDEICLVLEPYYKDSKTNFLTIVGNDDEVFVRLLRPRKYLVEELDLQRDMKDLMEIKKERRLSQTFTAIRDDLVGVGIMVNSYGRKRDVSSYDLVLYDEDCHNVIRKVSIDKRLMSVGEFVDVFFEPVASSLDKIYCFSLTSEDDEPLYPVSFYRAKTFTEPSLGGIYNGGELIIDGEKTATDVVFRLFYKD